MKKLARRKALVDEQLVFASKSSILSAKPLSQPKVPMPSVADFPKVAGMDKLLAAFRHARELVKRHHRLRKTASYHGKPMPPGLLTGVSVGTKISGGEDTGEPCLVFHVPFKESRKELGEHAVHRKLPRVATDVIVRLMPRAHDQATPTAPLRGGDSLSHPRIYNGSSGCLVTRPSETQPGKLELFVLSANHVLAACNEARLGDGILHPSPKFHGRSPADNSAILAHFAEIDWENYNTIDAAIAAIDPRVASRGLADGTIISPQLQLPYQGQRVFKVGITSGRTSGIVQANFYSGPIDYAQPHPRTALFTGLLRITPDGCPRFSEPGDSGSLVVDRQTLRPVGLIIAGAEDSYVCPLGPALDLLKLTLYG